MTDDGEFLFRQNTMYSSLMGQAQWLPLGQGTSFAPYLRMGAGASSIGPSAGLSGGIYYNIIGGIDAMLGYEGQMIFFNIEDEWYNSLNHGIVLGLSMEI
jgi:hypothetical protein